MPDFLSFRIRGRSNSNFLASTVSIPQALFKTYAVEAGKLEHDRPPTPRPRKKGNQHNPSRGSANFLQSTKNCAPSHGNEAYVICNHHLYAHIMRQRSHEYTHKLLTNTLARILLSGTASKRERDQVTEVRWTVCPWETPVLSWLRWKVSQETW